MYKIKTENVYEDFNKDICYLTSVIIQDSKYYNNTNDLFVGKMKNETWGVPIKGFVGLKSKIYAFITEENYESKKAKSINKNAVDDELKYKEYKIPFFNRPHISHEMNRIQSKDHNTGLFKLN